MFRYQTHELRYQNKCFKYEIYILMLIHLSLARVGFHTRWRLCINWYKYHILGNNTLLHNANWQDPWMMTLQKHSIQLTTIHDKLSCNKWFYFFYYMYTTDITKHFLAIIPWLSRIRFAILLYSLKYFT